MSMAKHEFDSELHTGTPICDVAALEANPAMQRIRSDKVEIFVGQNFLDADLCAELVGLIEAERKPSQVVDGNGDKNFRTSETCYMREYLAPVQKLELMLTRLSGIDAAYGELMQGQRYEVGQEFRPHCDYFNPLSKSFAPMLANGGQRTWTFMIYLNDVEAGGATRFKKINKTFQPEAGKLLCWNNRTANGGVNPWSMHHGMKVRKGRKYIITKWYRERPWQIVAYGGKG